MKGRQRGGYIGAVAMLAAIGVPVIWLNSKSEASRPEPDQPIAQDFCNDSEWQRYLTSFEAVYVPSDDCYVSR